MTPKKIAMFAIGPILGGGLAIITLPLLTWFFSVEDIGRFTMLQVVVGLSVMIFSLAMHQSYVREFHEESDKPALLKATVIPGLFLLIVSFFAICIFTNITGYSISNLLFEINSLELSVWLSVSVVSSFFINIFAHVIRMQERGLVFSITQVAPKVLLLIFIIVNIASGANKTFDNLMYYSVLSIFATMVIFTMLSIEICLSAVKSNLNVVLMIRMLKFSMPLVAGSLAYWALTAMDRFFIKAFSGLIELGTYAVATSVAAGVAVVSTIFSNVWHPIVYKWAKTGVDKCKVQSVTEFMLLGVALIWTVVGSLSWTIDFFLPPQYINVKYLVIACVAMPLFYMLSETTVIGIGLSRKTSYSMSASIIAFLINFVLNYLLVSPYGASGAALASAVAFFIFFVVRTEFSVYLWESIPRSKIYLVASAYLLTTIVYVIYKPTVFIYILIWPILFLVTAILYKNRVSSACLYLTHLVFRKN